VRNAGERSAGDGEEGVPVGGGSRGSFVRDEPGRAGAILDHDLLPEELAHVLGDGAHERIDVTACRETGQYSDGFGRERLGSSETGLREATHEHGGGQ
jgi:hypothetical protein